MVKDVWWDNVIFREFAAHFISMSDEQVVRDIRESVVKVINLDESGDSFGANMVRRAKERLCGRHDIAVHNGKQGGRPIKESTAGGDTREDSHDEKSARESQRRAGADSVRGTPLHSAPARSPARKFRNKEEYMQWAIDSGLDATDASECWDATLERGGKDADGNVVKNIKAFAVKWCKTRGMNRRTA